MEKLQFNERKFTLLLIDALTLARHAKDIVNGSCLESTFARGCILFSGILLECCANLLLDKVPGRALRKDLDKLPFLSKFDVYLRITTGARLDRGRNEVQLVEELKQLRDAFVHPKSKRVEAQKAKHPHPTSSFEFDIPFRRLSGINISASPISWRADDAIKAIRASEGFLRYIFRELLQMSSDDAFRLLVSGVELGEVEGQLVESNLEELLDEAAKMGLDFSFMFPRAALKCGNRDPI